MKLVRCWSHAPWVAISETYVKGFSNLSKNTNEKKKEKKKTTKTIAKFFELHANAIILQNSLKNAVLNTENTKH